ncbi:MAG TPA: WD40 repeat domain-containing protein [Ktedonobacterales bacterium]
MGSRWDRDPQGQDDQAYSWERDDGWEMSSWSQQGRRAQPPAHPQRSDSQAYSARQPQQRYPLANRQAMPARLAGGRDPQRKKSNALPVLMAILALLAVAALAGYLERSHIKALITPAPTATAAEPALVLPAFSDWRVAYLGQDGQLHAVSLDGKTDDAGMSLASIPTAASATPSATSTTTSGGDYALASPDGQHLLYGGANGPVLVHLTAQTADPDAARTVQKPLSSLVWSPDSARLAGLDSSGAIHLLAIASFADTTVPTTAGKGIQGIVGWLDASHLVVRVDKSGTTTEQIAALDVANGQQRAIVTLAKSGFGTLRYSLSPDGAHLLVWNTAVTGQSFTAILRNYDTKTGQARKLPTSLRATGSTVSAAQWKPGTQLITLSSGSATTHDFKLWLVDAANDTATSIGASVYPLGWVSDGSALIAGSALAGTPGGGPYTITALTFPSSGAPAPVSLTKKVATFSWLGLVKTA